MNIDGDDDEEFQKLMQRHNEEKQRVNTFEETVLNKPNNSNNMSNRVANESFRQDIEQNEINQDNNETYMNDINNNNSSRIQLEDNLITT